MRSQGRFVASGCELSCFNPDLQDQIIGIDGDRRCTGVTWQKVTVKYLSLTSGDRPPQIRLVTPTADAGPAE
jgi:hypothetical protein